MRNKLLLAVKIPINTIDAINLLVAISIAALLRFGNFKAFLNNQNDSFVASILFLLWILILINDKGQENYEHWGFYYDLKNVLYRCGVLFLLTVSLLFIFKIDISRLFIGYFFLSLFVLTLFGRRITRSIIRKNLKNGLRHHILLAGDWEKASRFADKLKKKYPFGLYLTGIITPKPVDKKEVSYKYLGGYNELKNLLAEQIIDEVFVVFDSEQREKTEELINLCKIAGKKVTVLFDEFSGFTPFHQLSQFEGIPAGTYLPYRERPLQEIVKRVFDIVFSLLVLVLTLPILILIAIAIKIDSPGGPVLFAQERIGLNGRRFKVLKFRTMIPDADNLKDQLLHLNEMDGPVFKITNDPRVTRVGRFLRKTSLDELPQFINVLKGEMSVVGPRPPLPREVNEYDPWHQKRLSVKPGITCIWQVSGRNEVSFEDWVKMDIAYIENRSLLLDLKLIIKTVFAVVGMTGK